MRNLYVLMTHRGLGLLGDICAHPEFGPYVAFIILSTDRITPEDIENLRDDINDWASSPINPGDIQQAENVRNLQAKLQASLPCSIDRLSGETELQESPGAAVELLTRAFESLKPYQTPVAIEIGTKPADFRWGVSLPLEKTGYISSIERRPIRESYFRSTIEPCLEAMARTQFPPYSLHLDVGGNLESFTITEETPLDLSEMEEFVAYLPRSLGTDGKKFLEPIWEGANDLRHLELWSSHYFGPFGTETTESCFETYDGLFQPVRFEFFDGLHLINVGFSCEQLIGLLDRHRSTLCTLVIKECAVRDGSWSRIFSWARGNLGQLEHLHLYSLFEARAPSSGNVYSTVDWLVHSDTNIARRVFSHVDDADKVQKELVRLAN